MWKQCKNQTWNQSKSSNKDVIMPYSFAIDRVRSKFLGANVEKNTLSLFRVAIG